MIHDKKKNDTLSYKFTSNLIYSSLGLCNHQWDCHAWTNVN